MADTYLMVACENIRSEVIQAAGEAGAGFPIVFIPSTLHLSPEKLRAYLQNFIDGMANVSHLLLPMGLCGNGTLGLVSPNAHIVLPNCNDCIDLLLSGGTLGKRPSRSYYLTESWLEGEHSITADYEHTITKYGEQRSLPIMRMIYKNYENFTFVDTGSYNVADAAARIGGLAGAVGMDIDSMPGPSGVLKQMMRLDFGRNFVVIPPGEMVQMKHFQ